MCVTFLVNYGDGLWSWWLSAQVRAASVDLASTPLRLSCCQSTVLLLVHAWMIRSGEVSSQSQIHPQTGRISHSHWPLWKVLMLMWPVLLHALHHVYIHEMVNHQPFTCGGCQKKIYVVKPSSAPPPTPPLIFVCIKEKKIWQEKDTHSVCLLCSLSMHLGLLLQANLHEPLNWRIWS